MLDIVFFSFNLFYCTCGATFVDRWLFPCCRAGRDR